MIPFRDFSQQTDFDKRDWTLTAGRAESQRQDVDYVSLS